MELAIRSCASYIGIDERRAMIEVVNELTQLGREESHISMGRKLIWIIKNACGHSSSEFQRPRRTV